jgi:hypothetical protein
MEERSRGGPELEADQPVMMRPRGGHHHGARRGFEPGELRGLIGTDACAGRQRRVRAAAANGDPGRHSRVALFGEDEGSGEGGAGLEEEDIAGSRLVERGLEVVARADDHGRSRGRGGPRVHLNAGALHDRPLRAGRGCGDPGQHARRKDDEREDGPLRHDARRARPLPAAKKAS